MVEPSRAGVALGYDSLPWCLYEDSQSQAMLYTLTPYSGELSYRATWVRKGLRNVSGLVLSLVSAVFHAFMLYLTPLGLVSKHQK